MSKNDYVFNIPVFIVNEKRESVSAVNASECSCSTGLSPDLVQVRCKGSLATRIRRGFLGGTFASQRVVKSELNQFALVEKQKEFSRSEVLTSVGLSPG